MKTSLAHHDQLKRLSRIRGQLDGIGRMIEERRYCVDILIQMRAVHAALRKIEEGILREHVEHCVADALKSTDRDKGSRQQQEKLDELFDVLNRYGGK